MNKATQVNCNHCNTMNPLWDFSDIKPDMCNWCYEKKYINTSIRIVCDVCDQEMPRSIKEDGIWVCKDCNRKFPKE